MVNFDDINHNFKKVSLGYATMFGFCENRYLASRVWME